MSFILIARLNVDVFEDKLAGLYITTPLMFKLFDISSNSNFVPELK